MQDDDWLSWDERNDSLLTDDDQDENEEDYWEDPPYKNALSIEDKMAGRGPGL